MRTFQKIISGSEENNFDERTGEWVKSSQVLEWWNLDEIMLRTKYQTHLEIFVKLSELDVL